MTTLEQLLDSGETHARNMLLVKRERQIMPFFHIVRTNGENFVLAAPWPNRDAKHALGDALRDVFREARDVTSYMFIAEAWIAVAPKGWKAGDDPPAIQPRDRPDRMEVVLISACDRRRETMRVLAIERNPQGGCVGLERQPELIPAGMGVFSNLLRDDA